jgi:hypothetical protein
MSVSSTSCCAGPALACDRLPLPLVQVLQRLESVVNNLFAVGQWTDRTEDRPSSKVKVSALLLLCATRLQHAWRQGILAHA